MLPLAYANSRSVSLPCGFPALVYGGINADPVELNHGVLTELKSALTSETFATKHLCQSQRCLTTACSMLAVWLVSVR